MKVRKFATDPLAVKSTYLRRVLTTLGVSSQSEQERKPAHCFEKDLVICSTYSKRS